MSIVSEKIELINEDFGVHVQGVTTGFKLSNGASKVIKDDSDWCFCCRVYTEDRLAPINTQNHNLYYDFNTGLNDHGIALGLNSVADTFRVFTYNGGAPIFGDISIPAILKRWSFICINYTSISNLFEVYIDNILVGTVDKTSVYQPFGQDGNNSYLFSNSIPNNCLKGIAKGAIIYDRKLNNQERQYMYETGLPSESSFSNIQNYYPLNQVAFKDGGLNYFNDVVKVYNPTATSARAQAIGYTDDELGLGTYGRGCASAYYNYHRKKPIGNFGVKMNNWSGTDNRQGWISELMIDGVPVGDQPDFTTGYTVVCHGNSLSTDGAGPGGIPMLYRTTNGLGYLEFLGAANTSVTLSIPLVSANISLGVISSIEHAVFTHKSNGDWYAIVNNKVVGSGNSTYYLPIDYNTSINQGYRIGTLFSQGNDMVSYNYNILFDYPIGSGQAIEALPKHDWFKLNPYRAYSCALDSNGDLIELVNGVYKGILETTSTSHIPTDEDALDVPSGLEPRKKALSFNGTSQYLETLNFAESSNGYTIILGVANINITAAQKDFFVMNDTNLDNIIAIGFDDNTSEFTFKSGNGGTITTDRVTGNKSNVNFLSYRISPTGQPYNYGVYDRVSDVSIQNRSVSTSYGYATRAGNQSIFIGKDSATNYTDLDVFYTLIIDGVINDEDLKRLINSGFGNNYTTKITNKYNALLYLDYNNPVDSSGLKITDLANSNTNNANGWDNLNDLENSLVDKETLF